MDTKTEPATKPRQEAPYAAIIFGALALISAFIATAPGFPMVLGGVGAIAGIVEIARAQRENRQVNTLAIVGVVAAVAGMVVSLLSASAV
jgi:uncharacterized membrane protein HdeD (DUF308 family)